jgi:hypothetical protein
MSTGLRDVRYGLYMWARLIRRHTDSERTVSELGDMGMGAQAVEIPATEFHRVSCNHGVVDTLIMNLHQHFLITGDFTSPWWPGSYDLGFVPSELAACQERGKRIKMFVPLRLHMANECSKEGIHILVELNTWKAVSRRIYLIDVSYSVR